jgi:hypothetical protein
MWPLIKRWRDWAMHDLWHMPRSRPQPQALHFSYEKAGLAVHDQPIPWNADVVKVEALLRLHNPASRRKADFHLRLPAQDPVPADHLRPEEAGGGPEDYYRVFFHLSPPQVPVAVEVVWRNQVLGQIMLPVLSRDEFVQRLGLQMPTLAVRLGNQTVACQTFVATQCKGLIASALLTSPTSLAPLLDLGLHVEFRPERGGPVQNVPVQLCSSQLKGRQALLNVVPPRFPRRIGSWLATWKLEDQPLATQRIRAISKRHFERSLRLSDSHFLVQQAKGSVTQVRQLPPLEELTQVVPCFMVSSREPGMAGLCRLEVRALTQPGAGQPPGLQQEVLITDGPARFAPGVLEPADLANSSGFELRLQDHVLGILSLSPAPTAAFTCEGGFKPAADFSWSSTAEEELNERLGRLLEERSANP